MKVLRSESKLFPMFTSTYNETGTKGSGQESIWTLVPTFPLRPRRGSNIYLLPLPQPPPIQSSWSTHLVEVDDHGAITHLGRLVVGASDGRESHLGAAGAHRDAQSCDSLLYLMNLWCIWNQVLIRSGLLTRPSIMCWDRFLFSFFHEFGLNIIYVLIMVIDS